MTNKRKTEDREKVLEAIKKRPYVTAARLSEVTGISVHAVVRHVTYLAVNEVIHSMSIEPKPGARQSHGIGYRFGTHPDIVAARESAKRIPAAWDVLAHFFGRIAAEPAIV